MLKTRPKTDTFQSLNAGLATHRSPLLGPTSVRFNCLSSGPVGPPTYFAVAEISRIYSCSEFELLYCCSPHMPVKYSQFVGDVELYLSKVKVDASNE
jgi:hypothetical protein